MCDAFFAVTSHAIITSIGYLLLNTSIIFPRTALWNSIIPFDDGDPPGVAFTFISN